MNKGFSLTEVMIALMLLTGLFIGLTARQDDSTALSFQTTTLTHNLIEKENAAERQLD